MAILLRTEDDDLYTNQPTLTDAQVKLYSEKGTTATSVFDDERLHIDFDRGWKRFPFNKEVRKIIIEKFLNGLESGMYRNPPISSLFRDPHWVGEALDGHINTLRRVWKLQRNPATPSQVQEAARKAAMSSRRATVSIKVVVAFARF